jgi:hypothetical protein
MRHASGGSPEVVDLRWSGAGTIPANGRRMRLMWVDGVSAFATPSSLRPPDGACSSRLPGCADQAPAHGSSKVQPARAGEVRAVGGG